MTDAHEPAAQSGPFLHISVLGPIASGKTTTAQRLASALGARYFDADAFTQNPFLADYVGNIPRWAFATELKFTHERAHRAGEIAGMLRDSHVVTDSGLLMSMWVFARQHLLRGTMTPAEWDFFLLLARDMTRTVPEPDVVVFLDLGPEEQLRRIAHRGRDFERAYTLDYLAQVTRCCRELAARLRQEGHSVIEVDTAASDIRDDETLVRLARRLPGPWESLPEISAPAA